MRYLSSLLRMSIRSFISGLASALWLGPAVTISTTILGGSPAHLDQAAASAALGLAIGFRLRRAISPSQLLFFLAWIGSAISIALLGKLLEPLSAIHPALALLALSMTSGLTGFYQGSTGNTRSSLPSLFAGFMAAFLAIALTLPITDASWPVGIGLALGLGLLLRPEKEGPTPAPAEALSPVPQPPTLETDSGAALPIRFWSLTLAILMGAMGPVMLRPLALGWSFAPQAPLAAASAIALALTLAALVPGSSRSGPAALPLLTGTAAAALVLELFLLPSLFSVGSAPFSGDPRSWLSAALVLGLWLLQLAPASMALLRSSRPGQGAELLAAAALGVLLSSMVAIPLLTTEGVLRALAMFLIAMTGLAILLPLAKPENRSFTRIARAGFTLLAAAVPPFAPAWNPAALLGLADAPSPQLPGEADRTTARPTRFVGEDAHGVVVVNGQSPALTLYVQRQPLFSPRDADAEAFSGNLPLLLHAGSSRALVIGTGSGIALDTARSHKLASLTWLNPSPLRAGVIKLFAPLNHQVLIDPRLAIGIGGLRPFAAAQPGRFDTITVLQVPGSALEGRAQYSLEGLSAIRRLLAPDGIAAIEVPIDDRPDWLLNVLAGFRQVFPGGLVWTAPGSARRLLLTGSTGPMTISYRQLEQYISAQTFPDPNGPRRVSSPLELLGQLLLIPEGQASLAGRPLTDRSPWEAGDPYGPASALPRMLPALRPLDPVIRDIPAGPTSVTLSSDLERIIQRHRAYLSMLGHLDQGVYTSVIDEARRIQQLAPQGGADLDAFTTPYLVRAKRLLEEGRPDKAIEQLTVARLINPRNAEAPTLLGRVYEQKKQRPQAIEHYQEALKLEPDAVPAVLALANLYREDKRLKEAAALLEDTLGRVPANAVLYHNLGSLYLVLDQVPRARELFDRAVRLNGKLGEPHAGLAEVFLQQGRLEEAQEEANTAVQLNPSAYALNLQGQVALRRGDSSRARIAFVQCLLKDPELVEARGAMGILYAEAGELIKAKEAWEAVLRQDPDNRAAKENLTRLTREYPGFDQNSSRH